MPPPVVQIREINRALLRLRSQPMAELIPTLNEAIPLMMEKWDLQRGTGTEFQDAAREVMTREIDLPAGLARHLLAPTTDMSRPQGYAVAFNLDCFHAVSSVGFDALPAPKFSDLATASNLHRISTLFLSDWFALHSDMNVDELGRRESVQKLVSDILIGNTQRPGALTLKKAAQTSARDSEVWFNSVASERAFDLWAAVRNLNTYKAEKGTITKRRQQILQAFAVQDWDEAEAVLEAWTQEVPELVSLPIPFGFRDEIVARAQVIRDEWQGLKAEKQAEQETQRAEASERAKNRREDAKNRLKYEITVVDKYRNHVVKVKVDSRTELWFLSARSRKQDFEYLDGSENKRRRGYDLDRLRYSVTERATAGDGPEVLVARAIGVDEDLDISEFARQLDASEHVEDLGLLHDTKGLLVVPKATAVIEKRPGGAAVLLSDGQRERATSEGGRWVVSNEAGACRFGKWRYEPTEWSKLPALDGEDPKEWKDAFGRGRQLLRQRREARGENFEDAPLQTGTVFFDNKPVGLLCTQNVTVLALSEAARNDVVLTTGAVAFAVGVVQVEFSGQDFENTVVDFQGTDATLEAVRNQFGRTAIAPQHVRSAVNTMRSAQARESAESSFPAGF